MQTRIRRKPGICRFTEMERDFISHLVRAALSWCQRISACWCMEIVLQYSIFVPQRAEFKVALELHREAIHD